MKTITATLPVLALAAAQGMPNNPPWDDQHNNHPNGNPIYGPGAWPSESGTWASESSAWNSAQTAWPTTAGPWPTQPPSFDSNSNDRWHWSGSRPAWWNHNSGCPPPDWPGWTAGEWSTHPAWTTWTACVATTTGAPTVVTTTYTADGRVVSSMITYSGLAVAQASGDVNGNMNGNMNGVKNAGVGLGEGLGTLGVGMGLVVFLGVVGLM